jgi:hypothetical protein
LAPSRPTRRFALLGLLALALGACLAPTLPIPPPSTPEVTAPDANGMATVTGAKGSATPGAQVAVRNDSLARVCTQKCGDLQVEGAADADGSWQLTIPARSKDALLVWQTVGSQSSNAIFVDVP